MMIETIVSWTARELQNAVSAREDLILEFDRNRRFLRVQPGKGDGSL